MKALISTKETKENGYRIAQINSDDEIFPVAEGLFWFECDETVNTNNFYYDANDNMIKEIIIEIDKQEEKSQPIVSGLDEV